ncbi:hypothetical protein [Aeromicrobium fastidiosum]|uniref:Secreted protein n=1 Tax=Aeromicrobium fastidiosum TaxID=52699 RepID=A0A641ASU5_9ACTN|nr:hypothetical protein [Aeromicrobium fastidiosum]KAA1380141.1 hypothetical protein ESP62_002760 [Aeromicrobium fastidiosum]MBP2389676.1 hypothetical protein [Aeromicrobium fastidiosum]
MVTATASLRRVIAALAVGGVLVAAPASSQADEPSAREDPGLPYIRCTEELQAVGGCTNDEDLNLYNWLNFAQVGRTGSLPAKQWAQIPLTMLASNVLFYGYSHYEEHPGPGELLNEQFIEAQAFLVSPKGSKDDYGDSALIPVRTVAFGSIPVEITLQVSQQRDGDDLPTAIKVKTAQDQYETETDGYSSRVVVSPAVIDQPLTVRVRKVAVDGVDVQLSGATCRTAQTARLRVASERQEMVLDLRDPVKNFSDNLFDPDHGFYGLSGGTLNGTIDIPAFTGCTTAPGDDLSPLLSSAISSPDNPVTLRIGGLGCFSFDGVRPRPTQPGANTAEEAGCSEIDNPNNPKLRTIPFPLDFPDYAPGDQPPE